MQRLRPLRLWLQALAPLTLAQATLPAYLSSLNTWLLTLGLALLLLAYALLRPGLRQSRLQWGSALLIGLLVAAGWWLTAHIGVDEFEPARLTSLSFIGPIADRNVAAATEAHAYVRAQMRALDESTKEP